MEVVEYDGWEVEEDEEDADEGEEGEEAYGVERLDLDRIAVTNAVDRFGVMLLSFLEVVEVVEVVGVNEE